MINREYYLIILENISSIFSELEYIGNTLLAEAMKENTTLSLSPNELKYYLRIIKENHLFFKSTDKDSSEIWNLKKRINYNIDVINSFFRQFEAVFFGTDEWYQRVCKLLNRLVEEKKELDRILIME